jgi:hypothetical protein
MAEIQDTNSKINYKLVAIKLKTGKEIKLESIKYDKV